jgi:Uma2 family endonuclease
MVVIMESEDISQIIINLPTKIRKEAEQKGLNLEQLFHEALQHAINEISLSNIYQEISIPQGKKINQIESSDIPEGTFLRYPHLSFEDYERIVDESTWEYISGMLIHHSPESNLHNGILGLLWNRARNGLDLNRYIVRGSRIALSIGEDKPEPDLMVFERETFRKKKRKDNTESEIIEATPLLIIEIVSHTSIKIDDLKKDLYLTKGVREYWQIFLESHDPTIQVHRIHNGEYKTLEYTLGEVRSQTLPEFAIQIEELRDPDRFK